MLGVGFCEFVYEQKPFRQVHAKACNEDKSVCETGFH